MDRDGPRRSSVAGPRAGQCRSRLWRPAESSMNLDIAITLVILLLTFVALARELLSPPATVLGAVVLLMVFGVVTPEQAFSGFSNPAPITVAALYVLARAVEKTGALQPLVSATLGRSHGKFSPHVKFL